MTTTVSLFNHAKDHGDRTAIIDNGIVTTYAELMNQSGAIAASLLAGDDDLNEAAIAFAAPGGSEYTAIQWGIWRAGGIAVPLNIHATLPEIRHCTDTAGVKNMIALKSNIFREINLPYTPWPVKLRIWLIVLYIQIS